MQRFLKTIQTLSYWYSLDRIALAEYSLSTNVPGFQLFISCCFLQHFVLAKLATSSIRVKRPDDFDNISLTQVSFGKYFKKC